LFNVIQISLRTQAKGLRKFWVVILIIVKLKCKCLNEKIMVLWILFKQWNYQDTAYFFRWAFWRFPLTAVSVIPYHYQNLFFNSQNSGGGGSLKSHIFWSSEIWTRIHFATDVGSVWSTLMFVFRISYIKLISFSHIFRSHPFWTAVVFAVNNFSVFLRPWCIWDVF